MAPISVFIASSSEARDVAGVLQEQVSRPSGVECVVWDQDVFTLGRSNLANLLDTSAKFDCAILVLSKDDLVTTRKTQVSSPRDNILFELGLFVGKLGPNRTFPVFEDGIKVPTDLLGISALSFTSASGSNLPSALGPVCSQLIRRIRSVGQRPDVRKKLRAPALGRGSISHIDFAADAILFLEDRRHEYSDELRRYLVSGDAVPMKYHYWTAQGAKSWLELCQKKSYPFFEQSVQLLENCIDEILTETTKRVGSTALDYISMGSGNGQKDQAILRALMRDLQPNEYVNYYPVEISDMLIVEAVRRTAETRIDESKLRIKAILGDFTKLKRFSLAYEMRPNQNFFALLGNSLGNQDELGLIRAIDKSMFPDDLLLFDINIGDVKKSLDAFEDGAFDDSVSTPLISLNASFDEKQFQFKIVEGLSQFAGTKSIVAICPEAEVGGTTYTNIRLAVNHHYDYGNVVQQSPQKFGCELLWTTQKDAVGILVGLRLP